jgi:hypothetical protein
MDLVSVPQALVADSNNVFSPFCNVTVAEAAPFTKEMGVNWPFTINDNPCALVISCTVAAIENELLETVCPVMVCMVTEGEEHVLNEIVVASWAIPQPLLALITTVLIPLTKVNGA